MITIMTNSILLLLLTLIAGTTNPTVATVAAVSSDDPSSSTSSEIYEAKIQKALDHFANHADELLRETVREGGGVRADDVDGPSSSSSSSSDSLYAELASLAVRNELERLTKWQSRWNDDLRERKEQMSYGRMDGETSGEEPYHGVEQHDDDKEVDYGYSDFVEEEDSEDFEYDDEDEEAEGDDFDYDYDYDDEVEEEEEEFEQQEQLDSEDVNQPPEDEWEDIRHEAELKSSLPPDLWWQFSYWELHAYFSCAAAFKVSRPVYDAAKWNDLRDFYHQFAARDLEDKPLQEGEGPRTFQYSEESYEPPLIPFQAGEKGRGLKASRNIAKGELVFKATNNTVVFTHGHTWRKFLFAIYERFGDDEEKGEVDSFTACDTLVWSWVQALEEDGPLYIIADLDNGSLMNEGRFEEGWEPPNVRCGKEGEECELAYYAMVDIKEGEEILCDYREFALLSAWPAMGL
mmetsp:Transcript_9471/g.20446  ORF Transcript_9471/g.20446 Transcript_9471/m.20446 type:complete len:461 (+) Transcript_9471:31-1413(+)